MNTNIFLMFLIYFAGYITFLFTVYPLLFSDHEPKDKTDHPFYKRNVFGMLIAALMSWIGVLLIFALVIFEMQFEEQPAE